MVSPSTTRVTLKVPETEEGVGVSVSDGRDVGTGARVGVGTGGLLTRPKIKLNRRSKKMPIPKTKFLFPIFIN